MAKDYYMTPEEWLGFNRDTRMFKEYSNNRYYCKCGHSVAIPNSMEKIMCSWCKNYVYKDEDKQKEYDLKNKKAYFKKELLKRL